MQIQQHESRAHPIHDAFVKLKTESGVLHSRQVHADSTPAVPVPCTK